MPAFKKLTSGTLLAVLALSITASSASAGETAYADRFGNLVVQSPAGFKRIIVGKGYLAERHAYGTPEHPKVAYLEERRGRLYLRELRSCRYGTLLRGRSYMYGLPDNKVPVPSAC